MSAEFFDTFGLIACGLNPNRCSTELYWFDTNKNRWKTIKEDILNIKKGYSHIAAKVFQFQPRIFYVVLMGGRNDGEKRNQISVYKFDPKGIQLETSKIF